jgi:hypothetical protein
MNTNHIALDKELRRDIDGIIQRLKAATMAPIENTEAFSEEPTQEQLEEWNRRSEERAANHRYSEERRDAIKSLQLAVMWLGMDLKAINDESPGESPNPYPQSYNPESPVVEKTADGLKL